jgi:hypothetical protein
LRATARCSGRNCNAGAAGAEAFVSELAKAFGSRPVAAIKPPNLAKKDLREQCGLTVCVVRETDRKGFCSDDVKQKFQKHLMPPDY